MPVEMSLCDQITAGEVVDLYRANRWSSADKPDELLAALRNSHCLVTARRSEKLIGIGNAISDGHLVVYFLCVRDRSMQRCCDHWIAQ